MPAQINDNVDLELSKDQVKYDIEQTVYALNSAYSGRRFLPEGQHLRIIKSLQEIQGPMTAAQLCLKIDTVLDSVADNHLGAKFNNKKCFSPATPRKASVGKNFYSKTGNIPWKVKLSKKKGITALLISIVSFPSHKDPIWKGFLESVKKNLSKAQFVVLDMRGNGGGDDSFGYQLSDLLAGKKLKSPYGPQWTSQTPESSQLFVNAFEDWMRQEEKDGKQRPPHLIELKQKYEEKRDKAINRDLLEWKKERFNQDEGEFEVEKSIKKSIYILVDAGCASSCESTIDFFEYNTFAKTVGENTAGYIHYGNNGKVFLKNSGIAIQMAISFNKYVDDRMLEKVGITPKIKVPPGKDAMDFAWKDFLHQ